MLAFPDAWYDLLPGVPLTGPLNVQPAVARRANAVPLAT